MTDLSRSTSRDLADLAPRLRGAWGMVERQAFTLHGVQIQITETHRSLERQWWLHDAGRSRPGPKLTSVRFGWHNLPPGRVQAVDFLVSNWSEYPPAEGPWSLASPWAAVGTIAEALGLRWGGRWGDFGHVELPGDLVAARRRYDLELAPTGGGA